MNNLKRSLALRTWADYSKRWNEWTLFCDSVGVNYIQTDVSFSLVFACSLMQRELAMSSILKMLAGVSFFLKLRGAQLFECFFFSLNR